MYGHRPLAVAALAAMVALALPVAVPGAERPPGPYQHKRLFGGDQPHLPAEFGECGDCHAPHFPAASPQLNAPIGKVCGECHDPFPGKTVHAPVARGECTACHLPHSAKLKDLLRRTGDELCTGCHREKRGGTHRQGVVSGECLGCHAPHATGSRGLLRGGIDGGQCPVCHAGLTKGKVGHSALAQKSCADCHNPHADPPVPTVSCLSCHPAVAAGKVVHEPVKEGCGSCHQSHSSALPDLLAAPLPGLCLDCHDDKKGGKHGRRAFLEPCTGCHSPHSSDAGGMIRGGIGPRDCGRCHDDLMEGKAFRHTPAKEGDCAGCHNPHSAPPVAPSPCTDCHDDLMRGRHPHKPATESCAKCHDSHASANPAQLVSAPPALCLSCHPGMEDGQHGKIRLGGDCLKCHDPHSAVQPRLLTLAISSTPCTSCHALMKEGTVVHKPVAADDCRSCHDPHSDPPYPTIACQECHSEVMAAEFPHSPAADDCLTCHFAHSGVEKKLLTGALPGLCIDCHTESAEGMHGKAQMSTDCLECHQPHAGNNRGLVKNLEGRRCESCHTGMRTGRFLHTALAKYECKDCHNPHANPREMPPLSCIQCHQTLSDKRPSHGSAIKERCLECHDPHSGENRYLLKPLKETSNQGCLSCHQGIRRSLELGASRHKVLEKGACVDCHTNHAGQPPFTRLPFSSDLLTPYATSAYLLCFSCHETEGIESEFTESDTRFRDGVRNLHYLHVVRDRVKGYSCWACHDSHAAYQDRLVNVTGPYQPSYDLKIKLLLRKDGGSCATNCHSTKEYRR